MSSPSTALVRVGRPPTPPERRDAICAAVLEAVSNGQTVHNSLLAAGVQWGTFWGWMSRDGGLAAAFARAREAGAHAWADRATATAEQAKPETVQVARLQHDAYKWRATVQAPREFGDKVELRVPEGITLTLRHE